MVRPLASLVVPTLLIVVALARPAWPDGRGASAGPQPTASTAEVGTRVAWLLARQAKDGSFGAAPATRVQTTALVVLGLSDRRLGADAVRKAAIARAVDHLIERQDAAGAFREAGSGADRTLLGLLALFAYQEDDGGRRAAGVALLGEGVAAAISAAPPGLPPEPTDDELVRVALTLAAP